MLFITLACVGGDQEENGVEDVEETEVSSSAGLVEHRPDHHTEATLRNLLDDDFQEAFNYSRVVTDEDSIGQAWGYEIGRDLTMEDLEKLEEISHENFEIVDMAEGYETIDEYVNAYGGTAFDLLDSEEHWEWCVGFNSGEEEALYFGCFYLRDDNLWVYIL